MCTQIFMCVTKGNSLKSLSKLLTCKIRDLTLRSFSFGTEAGWDLGPFVAVLAPEHASPGVAEYWETAWDEEWLRACAVWANS